MKFVNKKYNPSKHNKFFDEADGENAIEINFINYDDPLGTWVNEPWRIGTSYNRELFLVYVIYGFAGSDLKIIQYSFYLGKEVKND